MPHLRATLFYGLNGLIVVQAAVSVLMMFTFFFVIELVRMAYVAFGLWAYSLVCLILIALWFSFPRATVKKVMQKRLESGVY
jgi:MFS transporter, DHA1 family, multidrug/chloramphenicol efflux transport protein